MAYEILSSLSRRVASELTWPTEIPMVPPKNLNTAIVEVLVAMSLMGIAACKAERI